MSVANWTLILVSCIALITTLFVARYGSRRGRSLRRLDRQSLILTKLPAGELRDKWLREVLDQIQELTALEDPRRRDARHSSLTAGVAMSVLVAGLLTLLWLNARISAGMAPPPRPAPRVELALPVPVLFAIAVALASAGLFSLRFLVRRLADRS